MSKLIRPKNDTYWDSSCIVHKKKKLSEILEDELYYKPGDTLSCSSGIYLGGTLTGGIKQIVFSIPLPKSLTKINRITLNSMVLTVRKANGGYLLDVVKNTDFDGTIRIDKRFDNWVSVYCTSNAEFDAANNIPVAVCINSFNITFN